MADTAIQFSDFGMVPPEGVEPPTITSSIVSTFEPISSAAGRTRTYMVLLPFHLLRRQRGYDRMKCLTCSTETNNPKFCSRSCAVSHNNRVPKRALQNQCKSCETRILADRSFCAQCWADQGRDWATTTIADLKGDGNAVWGSYRTIRALSRKWYQQAGRPMSCHVCGYDLHVDIAHVRDIKEFPLDTSVVVVNAQENLVALCKNHHWEFDHGHLSLRQESNLLFTPC